MDGPYSSMALVSVLATIVSLGLSITLLVIAVSSVRPVDRSASGLFVLASVVSIVTLVVATGSSFLIGAVGTDSIETMLALRSALVSTLDLTGYALILAGIARLSKSVRRDPREPT